MPDQQPPAAAVTDEGIQPFSTRPSSNWGGEGCPPASHDGLIVQCLGPLRIWINGRELGFLSNRGARSVFKYLLLYRGRPTPKEQLMHLLWPSATPAAARNNLNVAVHRLRRFLSEDERARMVVYRQNGYELDPTFYSVTSKTFIGSIFSLFGMSNVADAADPDGAKGGYPQLSQEVLLKGDPDMIFLADSKCCQQSAASVKARKGWSGITAVKAGQIVALDDDIASRWGPRVVDLVQSVADAVVKVPA